MRYQRLWMLALSCVLNGALPQAAAMESAAAPASATSPPDTSVALIAGTHWHHVHLNATNVPAAIEYYTRHFNATRESLSGVQVGPASSLNFDEVSIIIYPVQYSQKVYVQDWGPGLQGADAGA